MLLPRPCGSAVPRASALMAGRLYGLQGLKSYVDNETPADGTPSHYGLKELGKIDAFSTRAPVQNKEWRKNQTIRDTHDVVHKFLAKAAGGEAEIASLLTDPNHGYITRYLKEDHKTIHSKVLDAVSPEGSERALLQKMGQAFTNASDDGDRRTLLQFVCKKHDHREQCRKQLIALGWRGLGDKLMKSTRDIVEAEGFVHKPLPTLQVHKPGGEAISEEKKAEIINTWYDNSTAASEVHGGYLEQGVEEIVENPLRFTNAPVWQIAYQVSTTLAVAPSTVVKYKPANVTKPVRKTDYCRYCMKWRRMLNQMRTTIAKLKVRYDLRRDLPSDHLRKFLAAMAPHEKAKLSDTDNAQIKEFLKLLHEHEVHRLTAKRQNAQHNAEVKSALKGGETCVIVYDFKENLKLGREPCERDDKYFLTTSCSCVGAIVFIDGIQVDIDHVSTVKNHSAEIATVILEKTVELLEREYPDKFHKMQTISTWSDCGPHFRAEIMAAFELYELPKRYKKNIKMNFFCEKHGKIICDAHFQKVGIYILDYSKFEAVMTPHDVQKGLLAVHDRVNEGRKVRKLPDLKLCVEVYTKDEIEQRRKNFTLQQLPIRDDKQGLNGIHSTYCLCRKVGENFVRNYIFSDVPDEGMTKRKYVKVAAKPAPVGKEKLAELRDAGDAPETEVASSAFLIQKRKKLLSNLEAAGNPMPGLALPEDLLDDDISVELRAVLDKHAMPRPKLAEARILANEVNRLVVFKDHDSGSFVFGRLLGSVSQDDVRLAGHGRKCIFREAYHPHATVCEIVEQEPFAEEAKAEENRTVFFLRDTAALPVECDEAAVDDVRRRVEPTAHVRHSHQVRLLDYWAQCSSCAKWRIVDYATYCTARKTMSVFTCAHGNCEAPQTEEELAGLEDAKAAL